MESRTEEIVNLNTTPTNTIQTVSYGQRKVRLPHSPDEVSGKDEYFKPVVNSNA